MEQTVDKVIEFFLFEPKSKLWIGKKGRVSVRKYARTFANRIEAEAVKKHFHNNNVEVEIEEIG